jgi:hypothetical protein
MNSPLLSRLDSFRYVNLFASYGFFYLILTPFNKCLWVTGIEVCGVLIQLAGVLVHCPYIGTVFNQVYCLWDVSHIRGSGKKGNDAGNIFLFCAQHIKYIRWLGSEVLTTMSMKTAVIYIYTHTHILVEVTQISWCYNPKDSHLYQICFTDLSLMLWMLQWN